MNNSKTNYISVALRRFTNQQLYGLRKSFMSDAPEVVQELNQRGFSDMQDFKAACAPYYGQYPTLEEYLAAFPEPKCEDNRDDTDTDERNTNFHVRSYHRHSYYDYCL